MEPRTMNNRRSTCQLIETQGEKLGSPHEGLWEEAGISKVS